MNYIILPLVGALIGWLVNLALVKWLLYSVVPKRLPALAAQLGVLATKEFLAFDIEKKISDPSNLEKAMPVIESHVDNFLRNKLKEQMPMVSMFIGDKTIQTIKAVFIKELETLFPEIMNQFAGNMKSKLNISKTVADKILSISPGALEQKMKKELRLLQLAGAVSGLLIGIAQVLIMQFL